MYANGMFGIEDGVFVLIENGENELRGNAYLVVSVPVRRYL